MKKVRISSSFYGDLIVLVISYLGSQSRSMSALLLMLTSSGGGLKDELGLSPAFMGDAWLVRAGSLVGGRVLAGHGGMFSRLS